MISPIEVVRLPWAFTQNQPLDTKNLIDEIKRRGGTVDLAVLRALYRLGLLRPFVELTSRRVVDPFTPTAPEPRTAGTRLGQLRQARNTGRMRDLMNSPYRKSTQWYPRRGQSPYWWNGLIYSSYQLLSLPYLLPLLARGRHSWQGNRRIAWLPKPTNDLIERARRLERLALVLTAIEARYLPELNLGWLHLVNAEPDEWRPYSQSIDAMVMSAALEYSAADARADAEWLLRRAHSADPAGGAWSTLMRRAPRKAWEHLRGSALLALEDRLAAEILLRFYEDLAETGSVEPLPAIPPLLWHPLNDRLSYRRQSLDQDLMDLGISPHPRVVLALEGDTEELHALRVWQALGYSSAPELVRFLRLGGVDRDLEKVGALVAAPLVASEAPDASFWLLIKPPAKFLVAIDPEGKFGTPAKVEKEREKVLAEIRAVLKAQGVTSANEDELAELVEIRTWPDACYEFAHFSDEEIADGILSIQPSAGGLTKTALMARISATRGRKKDIKEVWSLWKPQISKVELGRALWPVLEHKIKECMTDSSAPVPPIAGVIRDAYITAQRWRYQSFVLSRGTVPPESLEAPESVAA